MSYAENIRTFEIAGLTDETYYYGPVLGYPLTIIVSDGAVKNFVTEPFVYKVGICYNKEYDETASIKKAQGNLMEVGFGIVLILALIGIMNYVNTTAGNIQSRQVELSIMESIGMTQKQVKAILILEGILLAGSAVLLTLTAGLGITYFVYQSMNYMGVPFETPVRGQGDPNEEDGEYKQAISLLYGIAFTIKMSYKGSHKIEGYFSYVVPPLEGLWWQEEGQEIDFAHKETFQWISMIRLPDFVTKEEFEWVVAEASQKKKIDFSKVELFTYDEGECVQCMHIGSYDNEAASIEMIDSFARELGYEIDIRSRRDEGCVDSRGLQIPLEFVA